MPDTHNSNVSVIRSEVVEKLVTFLDTDTVLYHEDSPDALVKLQSAHWKPILEWAAMTYKIQLNTTTGVSKIAQPDETRAMLRGVVEEMSSLELAAFERACMAS